MLTKTKHYLLGWAAGIATAAAVAACAGTFVLLGGYDIAATSPHPALVAWALHETMNNSVKARTDDIQPPRAFSPAQLRSGAALYEEHCIACHGGPAIARARWASALVPTPPYLLDASRRWTPAQLYRIVHDGVKMTAMPAWGEVEDEQDIWNLVALIEAMPKLSPEQFARLRARPAAADRAETSGG